MQFDVPADCLVRDRIERIIADHVLAGSSSRRGNVVDPGNECLRIHRPGRHIDRGKRRDDAVHDGDDLLCRHARALGRRIGDRHAVIAKRKGRVGRKRLPDPVGQEVDPVLGHALIDAARGIAREIPFGEALADPRTHPLVELQTAGGRNRLREKLGQDLARAFVRADERRCFDHEAARCAVVEYPGLGIIAAIGQPMRQHRHAKLRPLGVGPLGVAQDPGQQALEEAPRHLTCPPARQQGSSRPSPSRRSPPARLPLRSAQRRHPGHP